MIYFPGRGKELLSSFTLYSCYGMDASCFHSWEPQTLGCKAGQACSFVISFQWKHRNTAAHCCVSPLLFLQSIFPCLGSLLFLLLSHHVHTFTFSSFRWSFGEQQYPSPQTPDSYHHNQNHFSHHSVWPKNLLSHLIFLSLLRASCHFSNLSTVSSSRYGRPSLRNHSC